MEKSKVDKAASVGNYLGLYLGQGQGVRLGESTVVSCHTHGRMPEKRLKGQIKIYTNRDAGKCLLDFVDEGQVVHIDVFHRHGEIDPVELAKALFWGLNQYFIVQDPQLQYAEDERFKIAAGYANKIFITTALGKGTVYELMQGKVRPYSETDEGYDHVHVLAQLQKEEYYLVYVIVELVEEFILANDIKLARVRSISHGNQKREEESYADYMRLPWKQLKGQNARQLPDKEHVNQLIIKLAEKFGGVREIEEFMENYSTNIFKRKGIEQQKKKWGDIENDVEQLEELGIIKDTIFGKVLTKQGQALKEFIITNQCELETEIRRNIRKMPAGGKGRYKKLGKSDYTMSPIELTRRNRTINNPDKNWSGDLAVPETIVQAKKNSFLRGDSHLTIKKEDLHYYDKKTYIPVDVCFLIDASGSMAGDKRQAACFLAEHLLLSGKEKVAVVIFQERSSQVVVPFTRKQSVLKKGLAMINPAGLTPLASGIMTAIEHIQNSRVKNPLLVLITDGIPNTPLWTMDAKADALEAAAKIEEAKINFICIGIEANRQYLEKLAERANGVLYVVDDLNRDNLINIVRSEKKQLQGVKP